MGGGRRGEKKECLEMVIIIIIIVIIRQRTLKPSLVLNLVDILTYLVLTTILQSRYINCPLFT